MNGWVANDQSKTSAMVGGSVVDKLRQQVHCRFCGGKACKHEDWTRAVNRKNTHIAIRGLHSNWVENWAVASQRLHTVLIEEHDIIAQFKECNLRAVFNLQECGEHPFCGPQGRLFPESGFSYVPETDLMTHGISYYNFPWPDMWTPDFDVVLRTVQIMCDHVDRRETFLVHCHAGLGRTGLMIACWLMYQFNHPFTEAVRRVRQQRPGAVQTKRQLQFTKNFYEYLCDLRRIFSLPEPESLTAHLERQNTYLHGQEARALRHVPKLMHTALTRVLDLVDVEFSELGTTAHCEDFAHLLIGCVSQHVKDPAPKGADVKGSTSTAKHRLAHKHARAVHALKKKIDGGEWGGVSADTTALIVLVEILVDFLRGLAEPVLCPRRWTGMEDDITAFVKKLPGALDASATATPVGDSAAATAAWVSGGNGSGRSTARRKLRQRGRGTGGAQDGDSDLMTSGEMTMAPPHGLVTPPTALARLQAMSPDNTQHPSGSGDDFAGGGGGGAGSVHTLHHAPSASLRFGAHRPGVLSVACASNPQSPALSPAVSPTSSHTHASQRSTRKLPPLGFASGDGRGSPVPETAVASSADCTTTPNSPCTITRSPPLSNHRRFLAVQCRTGGARLPGGGRAPPEHSATAAFRDMVAVSNYHTTGILISALRLVSWDLPPDTQRELTRAGVKALMCAAPSDVIVDFFLAAGREWGHAYFSREKDDDGGGGDTMSLRQSMEKTQEGWLSNQYASRSAVQSCPYRHAQAVEVMDVKTPGAEGNDAGSEGYGTGEDDDDQLADDDELLRVASDADATSESRGSALSPPSVASPPPEVTGPPVSLIPWCVAHIPTAPVLPDADDTRGMCPHRGV